MKVYIASDTGPSGYGEVGRGIIQYLADTTDIDITVRTHQWVTNREGFSIQNLSFPDSRLEERMLRDKIINEPYVLDNPRDIRNRENDLLDNLGTNGTISDDRCIIRQFEGKEDIWLGIGSMGFAMQAPEHAYSIISTDYNLDIVPETWKNHIDRVDEVWVPSEWTKESIEKRVGEIDKIKVAPYGVDMRHRPTEYDCSICLHNTGGESGSGMKCLRDGKFNFLIVSRFYHIKGIYRTARAFVEEFNIRDDVRLVIKTTSNGAFEFNPVQTLSAVQQRFGWPNPPEIAPVDRFMGTQYLYDLMGHCDAFLQISRAECFGLAQLQAAYCGTPVVYTNWSAQKELFEDVDGGFFSIDDFNIERPRQELPGLAFQMRAWPGGPPDDNAYPSDSNWATPSVDNIRERMRQLYEMESEELEYYGEQAKGYVEENFKWSDAIELREGRFREIQNA